ncbi:hypothetical protein BN12_1020005 [Nostocoides japonicum T1-X7]|uniref:DUF306 domain-containing protein n=1 Tax=Nostocoides japonicum T1-X7 TaxID=1194083 RepID=A0A077LVQ3_9MICO|nr:META domain-containing protein [Tetrasphaera japonica]CCH76040.1 hypothetical protein BN12_1020005 [Tetrasphaera japonica T1-X7]
MGDELSGTAWTVVELSGEPTQEPRPQVRFGEDGRVSGTTGVNRLIGTYAVDADGLLDLKGATTLMAGPEAAMRQESALLRAIGAPVPFTLSADRLELAAPDGSVGVVLVPAAGDPVLV